MINRRKKGAAGISKKEALASMRQQAGDSKDPENKDGDDVPAPLTTANVTTTTTKKVRPFCAKQSPTLLPSLGSAFSKGGPAK